MSGPEISPEIDQPIYAGIGARATPPDVLDFMGRMGRALRQWGWWLNSGHAPGADQAWEEAAGTEKTVYLPWAEFESEARFVGQRFTSPTREAIELAMKHRRSFAGVSAGVAALLGRNAHIVLGRDLIHPPGEVRSLLDSRRRSGRRHRARAEGGQGSRRADSQPRRPVGHGASASLG